MKTRVWAFVAGLFAFTLVLVANDFPQWRGPQRTGISEEKGLLKDIQKLIVKNIEVISDHPYALATALADMKDYSKNSESLVRKRPGGGRRGALVRPARSR